MRKTVEGDATTEYYPLAYVVRDTIESHPEFALRRQSVDLGIIIAALEAMGPEALEPWIRTALTP